MLMLVFHCMTNGPELVPPNCIASSSDTLGYFDTYSYDGQPVKICRGCLLRSPSVFIHIILNNAGKWPSFDGRFNSDQQAISQ